IGIWGVCCRVIRDPVMPTVMISFSIRLASFFSNPKSEFNSHPQISLSDMFVPHDFLRSPLKGYPPCFQNITPVAMTEGKGCILFNKKDGYSPLMKLFDRSVNFFGNFG